MGFCYYNGYGVEQNYDEAARWYKMAADKGYSDAMYYLGTHYMDGDGVSQSTDEAIRLWKAAAEQGNENAYKALVEYGY
ncbi:MAG: sel1 repeat family protein [Bacteroidaceae bacterium]|nr:sel1 repeat family protein [Bacteroidaceae bacterium]